MKPLSLGNSWENSEAKAFFPPLCLNEGVKTPPGGNSFQYPKSVILSASPHTENIPWEPSWAWLG